MRPFKFTGVSACNGKTAAPVLLNDTYTDELHMDGKDAYATLATNEPGEKDGGRRVYWTTSDKTVATVDKNGTVRARTDSGECTITATLADGTPVPVQAPPYRFEGARLPIRHAPPTLGQHTAEVLGELGVDAARFDALRQGGVV